MSLSSTSGAITVRESDYDILSAAATYEKCAYEPASAALVIIDLVNWQVPDAPVPGTVATEYYLKRVRELVIPRTRTLLDAARSQGMTVAFLRVGCYRDDFDDAIPPFREIFRNASARDGEPAMDVLSELEPQRGEISLVKTGSSGFLTSGLHQHLQNIGIRQIVYTGVLTSACVLLTAASGFDLGYQQYVVSDATATSTDDLQRTCENLIGTFIAEVVTTETMVAMMGARRPVTS